jgi:hypothetical protein
MSLFEDDTHTRTKGEPDGRGERTADAAALAILAQQLGWLRSASWTTPVGTSVPDTFSLLAFVAARANRVRVISNPEHRFTRMPADPWYGVAQFGRDEESG